MNRNERANLAAEYGFSHPARVSGQPVFSDFGTALSIGSSLLGAAMQDDSAGDAVQAQGESSAAAIAEQRRQYDQNRTDLAPWREAGSAATNRLAQLLGLVADTSSTQWNGRTYYRSPIQNPSAMGPQDISMQGVYYTPNAPEAGSDFGSLNKKFTLADFWDDPVTKASFQFGLDEGTKALDRMSGARGMRNSGQALKALTRFGTDYTGQKAGESYNRFYGDQDRTYNRLAGVAGTGQTAAQNTASMGANTANNISSLISGQGNARGAAAIAGGNAWANAGSQISNNYQQQSILDRILNRGTIGGGIGGGGWGGTVSDPWYG